MQQNSESQQKPIQPSLNDLIIDWCSNNDLHIEITSTSPTSSNSSVLWVLSDRYLADARFVGFIVDDHIVIDHHRLFVSDPQFFEKLLYKIKLIQSTLD